MEFEQRIYELLRARATQQRSQAPTVPPFSSQFVQAISSATERIEHVLRILSRNLDGSVVIAPGTDPYDPSFYVVALRIPQLDQIGIHFPLRLFIVVTAVYKPSLVLQIVRVVAIGRRTQTLPTSSFLRAWNDAGVGGVVIYEGGADVQAIESAVEQGVLRFLARRDEIAEWYRAGKQDGRTLVWPIDPSFHPRLCDACLIPIDYGIACPKCGTPRNPR